MNKIFEKKTAVMKWGKSQMGKPLTYKMNVNLILVNEKYF